MEVINSLAPVINLCQAFGLVSVGTKETNGKVVLCESRKHRMILRVSIAVFVVLQMSLWISTTMEVGSMHSNISTKFVKLLHMTAFTCNMGAVYLTSVSTGGTVCRGLNTLNELSEWFLPRHKIKDIAERNKWLLAGGIMAYLLTIVPIVVTEMHRFSNDVPKLASYVYFAACLWLENAFLHYFVNIAHTVGQVYGSVTRLKGLGERQRLRGSELLRRRLLNEGIVKDFLQAFAEGYQYVLFCFVFWSYTVLLHFVMKPDPKPKFILWACYISYRMVSVILACGYTDREVEKTAHHLHELFIEIDDPLLKEEIEIFSLQLMHRKAEFNACGFFKLDFSLLHSMIATVSTYIIILMQLQDDSKMPNCSTRDPCANCTAVTEH